MWSVEKGMNSTQFSPHDEAVWMILVLLVIGVIIGFVLATFIERRMANKLIVALKDEIKTAEELIGCKDRIIDLMTKQVAIKEELISLANEAESKKGMS